MYLMSFTMFKILAEKSDLEPFQKLILFQLCSFKNTQTGQCNPSPERIAYHTKLSTYQVRKILKVLQEQNVISRTAIGYEINIGASSKGLNLVPKDWWPENESIDALVQSYPQHHFDMEEAVNDFINFCSEQEIYLAPDRINRAFVKNISQILDNRKAGRVQIKPSSRKSKTSFISNFLNQSNES